MSFDTPFYENTEAKKEHIMEQTGADEATVMALLGEWREEENLDIEALLRQNSYGQLQSEAKHPPAYSGNNNRMFPVALQPPQKVPTFQSAANRPSVLDLSTTMRYDTPRQYYTEMSNHHMQPSPVSPHHAYTPNSAECGVFNYSNEQQVANQPVMQHLVHMQHEMQQAPHSPHNLSNHSGLSPHYSHGPISPHASTHSGSVSPGPRQVSPAPSSVFSRYAGGSPLSMTSSGSTPDDDYLGGYSSCQMDGSRKRSGSFYEKGGEVYKAKRERNNVAVRKSREKKKQREVEMEQKVKELSDENSNLQSKLDCTLKEMSLLKSLYKTTGMILPTEARVKLEKELAKFDKV